jgi:glycosyltransferase involved in cell wall biosynthesis
LAVRLGVESRVDFVGGLRDAAQYLRAFDALLFASGPAEAFGIVLVEAMLAGVPVVCADAPGPRSVLGPDGLYFDGAARDALNECARLSERARARMCEAQRARAVRKYSVDAIAEVYRGVLNTGVLHPKASS